MGILDNVLCPLKIKYLSSCLTSPVRGHKNTTDMALIDGLVFELISTPCKIR